jgi:bifunctional UDP-N-acetylglucosamine pyrophosphorylase/glucosamine-1-phosphate N-acetyltransferase
MSSRSCLAIILAAGEGTRMRSALPKVMHKIGGLPMLGHVLETANETGADRRAVVIGAGADAVRTYVDSVASDAAVYVQAERLGTAHAVLAAKKEIAAGADDVIVLYGDTPLVTPKTLQRLRRALAKGADIVVLGFRTPNPTGYGRLIEEKGKLVAIREEKDASKDERAIDFCNAGIMGFRGDGMLTILRKIGNGNAKGEFYLPDAVAIAVKAGKTVVALEGDAEEFLGINSRGELSVV